MLGSLARGVRNAAAAAAPAMNRPMAPVNHVSSLSNSVQQELEQLRADYARQAAELARCNDLLSQIRQEVPFFLFLRCRVYCC
jgi:hypothetical protein